jgi:hypothetical protein
MHDPTLPYRLIGSKSRRHLDFEIGFSKVIPRILAGAEIQSNLDFSDFIRNDDKRSWRDLGAFTSINEVRDVDRRGAGVLNGEH